METQIKEQISAFLPLLEQSERSLEQIITYGKVEIGYFPMLLMLVAGMYEPGPGTAPLIMMFSGSAKYEQS